MNDYMKYQKLEEKSEPPKEAATTVPVASTAPAAPTTPTPPAAKNIPINIVTETDLEMLISISAASAAMSPSLTSPDGDKSTKPSNDCNEEAFDNGKQK